VPSAQKIELISRLVRCGLRTVEAGSFVSPKWVPQLADGHLVVSSVINAHASSGVEFPVLTPNLRGYEAAREAGASHIAIFGSASESFSQKNINCSIAESITRFESVVLQAKRDNVKIRGYVSCVLGCPYEGPIAHTAVERVAHRMLELGCYEVSLGDTIGIGTAGSTEQLLQYLLRRIPAHLLAAHFHDTYGQALANLLVALQHGIATIDSSVAGLGGCPYAPAAKGNVATEDVLYMLQGLGVETGVDLDKVVDTAAWISENVLGRPPASRVATALLARRSRLEQLSALNLKSNSTPPPTPPPDTPKPKKEPKRACYLD
jgi:hydroxymethylglutaryl-CoA lyase